MEAISRFNGGSFDAGRLVLGHEEALQRVVGHRVGDDEPPEDLEHGSDVAGGDIDGALDPEAVEVRVEPGFGAARADVVQVDQELPVGVELGGDAEALHHVLGLDGVHAHALHADGGVRHQIYGPWVEGAVDAYTAARSGVATVTPDRPTAYAIVNGQMAARKQCVINQILPVMLPGQPRLLLY